MEKALDRTTKKFNSRMQARLLLVFCVIAIMLVGLMGRLIYIVHKDGDRYAKQVLSRQAYVSSILPYKRGDILDRNGAVLATSELHYRLILDPNRLLMDEDCIAPTVEAISTGFGIDADKINTILQEKKDSQYVILAKKLDYDTVTEFKKLMGENDKITGVWFEEEYVRKYPYSTLASDVLGFVSADNTGYWGIEEYYNDWLNGTNGREYGYYDSSLNIERIVKEAINGHSIVSTIDINVQRIIQKHIKEFNTEFGSKNIGVLIMDPNNGEIIAMASNEEYDLNNPRNLEGLYTETEIAAMSEEQKMEALNALWKNDVISSGFEPGSTFKPVTVAAALEEGLYTENSTFYCDGGEQVGDSYIHCSKRSGHGEITLGEALMVSCNDALMQIVKAEGRNLFYNYQTGLGLGQKTGIDLPGEASGILISEDKLNATELATSSFGQSFNATMIQMATAYASLVNGGYYYQPHVMKQIKNDKGTTVKTFDKVLIKRTVSEKTSEFIQKYMYQTVEAGTAKGAKVSGYAIGGKTGTAQKFPREAKTYVVSFLGQVPAINPEIIIYVMIDEPQNVEKQADSSIATQFASRILTEVLPTLGIYPEGDIDYLLPSDTEENGTDGQIQNGNSASPSEADNTTPATSASADSQAGATGTEQNNSDDNPGREADPNSQTENHPDGENEAGSASNNQDTANSGTEQERVEEGARPPGENANQNSDDFNPDAIEPIHE